MHECSKQPFMISLCCVVSSIMHSISHSCMRNSSSHIIKQPFTLVPYGPFYCLNTHSLQVFPILVVRPMSDHQRSSFLVFFGLLLFLCVCLFVRLISWSSSEKVDEYGQYGDFNITQVPYPGNMLGGSVCGCAYAMGSDARNGAFSPPLMSWS